MYEEKRKFQRRLKMEHKLRKNHQLSQSPVGGFTCCPTLLRNPLVSQSPWPPNSCCIRRVAAAGSECSHASAKNLSSPIFFFWVWVCIQVSVYHIIGTHISEVWIPTCTVLLLLALNTYHWTWPSFRETQFIRKLCDNEILLNFFEKQ